MRYLVGFMCVVALGVMPLVGCGTGGNVFSCEGNVCPCTEAGIQAAIAVGGDDRYTFACDGPTRVVTEAEIVIDNDVILDGEGNLIVDGDDDHRVLSVPEGMTAELRGFTVQNGAVTGEDGAGIANKGVLTIRDCLILSNRAEWSELEPVFANGSGIHNAGAMAIFDTTVSKNSLTFGEGAGIHNAGEMSIAHSIVSHNGAGDGSGGGISNATSGTLMLMGSTVSDNGAGFDGSGAAGGGIRNSGEMTILNSTISGNEAVCLGPCIGGGIANVGKMAILNSTVSRNSPDAIGTYSNPQGPDVPYLEMANTLIDGGCDEFLGDALEPQTTWVSDGYDIESPGDTCGFDQLTDQVDIPDPMLGPLQDNGGPTMTHALLPGSVAIDVIPADMCEVTEDQRGFPRDSMCDVGAFEVQP